MNRFDELFKGENFQIEQDERKSIRWEEATIKHVLLAFGLGAAEKALRREYRRLYDTSRLSLALFHETYPTFPIYFGTKYMTGLHQNNKCIMPQLFKNFSATPVVEAFEEFLQEVPEERQGGCIGLVFPRRGYARGMIIHTGHGFWRPNLTRLVYDYGTPKNKKRLIVEPFGELIKWMSRHRKWVHD